MTSSSSSWTPLGLNSCGVSFEYRYRKMNRNAKRHEPGRLASLRRRFLVFWSLEKGEVMLSGRSGQATLQDLERLVLPVRVEELVFLVQREHDFLDQLEVLAGDRLLLQLEVVVELVRRVLGALDRALLELLELEIQEEQGERVELAQEYVLDLEVQLLDVGLDRQRLAAELLVGLAEADGVDDSRGVDALW